MAVKRIRSPLDAKTVRGLTCGERVLVSGTIVTGRDQVHKYLAEGGDAPIDLSGMVIYHCGPVVVKDARGWKITAAGPTTSMREEPYQAKVIERFRIGAVMGKGGMGPATLAAMQAHGSVYLHVTGGAAQYLARCITAVQEVHLLERFGQPEAMWVLAVQDLPAYVTMDSHGKSLHTAVEEESARNFKLLLEEEA
ncbi:MAG: FumA C-terminus/TtdB family hydratase beta subunit [Syntrophaceae bacterium]